LNCHGTVRNRHRRAAFAFDCRGVRVDAVTSTSVSPNKENLMKRFFAGAFASSAIAVGLLAAAPLAAQAQTHAQTPGLKMQEKGSVSGTTGASGYTPGHQMQQKGSVKGTTGASGYAPGHATTGAGVNGHVGTKAGTRSGVKAGGVGVDTNTNTGVGVGGKINTR
jgi:hypothetical protein